MWKVPEINDNLDMTRRLAMLWSSRFVSIFSSCHKTSAWFSFRITHNYHNRNCWAPPLERPLRFRKRWGLRICISSSQVLLLLIWGHPLRTGVHTKYFSTKFCIILNYLFIFLFLRSNQYNLNTCCLQDFMQPGVRGHQLYFKT